MKLKRTVPAVGIWVVFIIFDIVMIASSSFFLGLFPKENRLAYSVVFTILSTFVMSVIMILAGRCSDTLEACSLPGKASFRVTYFIVIALIMISSVWYRVWLLGSSSADITGKMSLYQNAMVGGTPQPEYDLLSIVYSAILKVILLFTGNIMSVPFHFQIACFVIFMICGFFTVLMLLGYAAAFVFTAYVAFMPVFTPIFTGLTLSTDYLFMAMFGIELVLVALFLRGVYKGRYNSPASTLCYLVVGIVVGFMAYLDAGTIIMILPFLLAVLILHKKSMISEFKRLLWVVFAAVTTFTAMICQEQGVIMAYAGLSKWASYYFHNLNTFSMFWAYTDYKIVYLVTVIIMSGVIVGFWKNRHIEKISPWLLSMLFIFATVPFMGATRMNTQVFVTVYYAFILGCVASLITLPSDEGAGDRVFVSAKPKSVSTTDGVSEVLEPEYEFEADDDEDSVSTEPAAEGKELEPEAKELEQAENADEEFTEEAATEPESDIKDETTQENEKVEEEASEEGIIKEDDQQEENTIEESLAHKVESNKELASATVSEELMDETESEITSESETKSIKEPRKRYVPEGMVLPEDDEDVDLTPRMKIPEFTGTISLSGTNKSASVISKNEEPSKDVKGYLEADYDYNHYGFNEQDTPKRILVDDFDVDIRPGDDFDI